MNIDIIAGWRSILAFRRDSRGVTAGLSDSTLTTFTERGAKRTNPRQLLAVDLDALAPNLAVVQREVREVLRAAFLESIFDAVGRHVVAKRPRLCAGLLVGFWQV